jgi:hypothetical protein
LVDCFQKKSLLAEKPGFCSGYMIKAGSDNRDLMSAPDELTSKTKVPGSSCLRRWNGVLVNQPYSQAAVLTPFSSVQASMALPNKVRRPSRGGER